MKTVTMRNILLISFCIILFVLQDWFQQHLEVFQYADELFALLIVPMAVLRFLQKKLKISWTRERILFALDKGKNPVCCISDRVLGQRMVRIFCLALSALCEYGEGFLCEYQVFPGCGCFLADVCV